MIFSKEHKKKWNTRPCVLGVTVVLGLLGTHFLWPGPCYACGTPGQDGPNLTLNGIVNTYYPGVASVAAGGTSILLGSAQGNTTTLQPGDQVLIIQMQDASMDSSNTDRYGDGISEGIDSGPKPVNPPPNAASGSTNLNNSGIYEFNIAKSAVGSTGGTLILANPLLNSYTDSDPSFSSGQKRFQVVRVPQYSSATLSGTVTVFPWDGNVGGIVAFDVAGHLNFNGQTIDVSRKGFRGGLAIGSDYVATSQFSYAEDDAIHGYKGEGIAGTPATMWDSLIGIPVTGTGYPGGSRSMGAPGNAGGGGSYDSAGGGGANYGAGGRGGDEHCPSDPPQSSGTSTSICGFIPDRAFPDHDPGPLGGMGGKVEPGTLSNRRLLMGGGGGGGADHISASARRTGGGRGGGIVLIRTGTSSGAGTINANGLDAPIPDSPDANASGGGGGGTVYIVSGSSLSGLTIKAKGGNGGSNVTNHAPGGGGGGGVVYQSGGALVDLSGGTKGLRVVKPPLGALNATSGNIGLSESADPNDSLPGGGGGSAVCLPVLTVTKITTTPARAATDTTASYTITVSNASGKGVATGVNITDDLPAPFTYSGTPVTITYTGGAAGPVSPMTGSGPDPVTLGTAGGSPSFSLPGGGSIILSFSVLLNGGTGLFQNPASTSFLDPTRTVPGQTATPGGTYASGVYVGGSNYDPSSSTGEDVLVGDPIELKLTKSVRTYWDPVNMSNNPRAIPGSFMEYTLTLTNPSPEDVTGVSLIDQIPREVELFFDSSGPVSFTDGSPSSGLTTPQYEFSSDAGMTFTYTPVPNVLGIDSNVTNIRINPQGTLKNGTSAIFTFQVRIK